MERFEMIFTNSVLLVNISSMMYVCLYYVFIAIKVRINDGIQNFEEFLMWHIISYLCFRFGKQISGAEKGPYVLILSISSLWKK